MFDFIIIGAGVVGASIARELSKYKCRVALVEKEADVSLGASKANSGIIHGGYVSPFGSLKADLCIRGNRMYDQLEKELNFGFKRIGGLVLGFEGDHETLQDQYDNGMVLGEDMHWLNKAEIKRMEPNINEDVKEALYIPKIGIASPYELVIALVENAIANGLELYLNEAVESIELKDNYIVKTSNQIIQGRFIINAAGLHSGVINQMLGDDSLRIIARRGQYLLLGKDQNNISHVLFQAPSHYGKGVLVTPTVHGNLMIGPDAEDLMDDVRTDTQIEKLIYIINQAQKTSHAFDIKRTLTTFSGIRAMADNKDFHIQYAADMAITVGGIDSPGLTAAPAIAKYVVAMIQEKIQLEEGTFDAFRPSYYRSDNGEIICKCEDQGINRIKRALRGPIKIESTDAIKRRLRAGMGNCQGKRCEAKVRHLIAEHLGVADETVTKRTEKTQPKRVSLKEIRDL